MPGRLPVVDVAACIAMDGAGRILLAERTARQIAAGFWELPGGKIDPGETPQQAAARELYEETGIRARSLVPWITYEHVFRTKRIRLHFFRVDDWTGSPHGREGQRLAWVDPAALQVAPILPSNDRVLAALRAGPHYAVARVSGGAAPAGFVDGVQSQLDAGTRLLQLSAPQMAPAQLTAFARRIVDRAKGYGASVLLEGSALQALQAGADGVVARPRDVRPPVRLWAALCRDEGELRAAIALGADLALLLPPARVTGNTAWETYERLAMAAPIPVYGAASGNGSPNGNNGLSAF